MWYLLHEGLFKSKDSDNPRCFPTCWWKHEVGGYSQAGETSAVGLRGHPMRILAFGQVEVRGLFIHSQRDWPNGQNGVRSYTGVGDSDKCCEGRRRPKAICLWTHTVPTPGALIQPSASAGGAFPGNLLTKLPDQCQSYPNGPTSIWELLKCSH